MTSDLWRRYREPERGFTSFTQVGDWPEGLLVGSGTLGAIMMGHPQKECVIVTHEELFLPLFERLPVLEMSALLPDIRAMISRGEYGGAAERVVSAALDAGYPKDFVMTDPSHPAFDLLVDTGPYAEVDEYLRSVNFLTGEASVSFRDSAGGRWLKRCFASRADGALVFRVECENPFDAEILLATRPAKLEAWEHGRTSPGFIPKGAFQAHGIGSVERTATAGGHEGELLYRVAYAKDPGGYEGLAQISANNGVVRVVGTSVRVLGATSVDVVVAVSRCPDAAAPTVDDLRACASASGDGYETALARHSRIHGDLFGRVRLTLEGGDDDASGTTPPVAMPVEDLIEGARSGEPSPGYIQLLFDACRYNIICSSGKLPPNLQGVWSGTWTPHWSGDYTLDANVQAAVAHDLSCGTPELLLSLFELMDRMMPDFRENARALYGARGVFVNSRVSTTGLQQRYNMCPMYFWTAGAAWIAHYYYDYYLYTNDQEFLERRALPFMVDAALFYEDFLTEGPGGRYEFNPSVSPENHPGNTDSLVTLNATMDVAAVRELLRNLLSAATVVAIDEERCETWRAMLRKLPDYEPNNDGALAEWITDALTDNYSHRHMSHLYPLYPGDEADPEQTPELHKMVLKAFQMRMEHYNPRDYGSFGLYHVAAAAARAGDAETSWEAIRYMARWHVYSGMATSHDPGPSIFNMDASGGLPAALVEMLVVSKPGKVRLLPAVPAALSVGAISGVRCRGGIVIEELAWDLRNARSVEGVGGSAVPWIPGARAVLRAQTPEPSRISVYGPPGTVSISVADSVSSERVSDTRLDLNLDPEVPIEVVVTVAEDVG